MPLARRTARIWSGHHGLQSLQQMVTARALAAPVRADCSFWRCSSRTQPRQFACEGAPLGLADDRGRPVAFALTPGNVADISMAVPLTLSGAANAARAQRQWAPNPWHSYRRPMAMV